MASCKVLFDCNHRILALTAFRTKSENFVTKIIVQEALKKRIKQHTMAKKLYVGGIPYSTTEDDLKGAFAQAGEVLSSAIIIDKMTGRSKGFGFVEMANDADADKAIDLWNGKDFQGRTLTVNEARPLEERPRREFGGGNRRMG